MQYAQRDDNMSNLKLVNVHDFDDGESHICITADFTIYRETTSKEEVEKAFRELMMKYAI